MKILALYLIVALVSSSLAKSADKRKTKTKLRSHVSDEAHRNRHPQRSSLQRHNSGGGLRGHREKLRIPFVDEGNREKPKIPDEGNRRKPNTVYGDKEIRERRPRQSPFTIPQPASILSGGNQNSGSFQLNSPLTLQSSNQNQGSGVFSQGPPLQFVGNSQGGHPGNQGSGAQQDNPGFQGGNHPGNQGGQLFPGVITAPPSIGNQGGGGIFHPGSSFFSPGTSDTSGSLPSGSSSVGGPGGISSSSPDSGLAGGLGGAYGGGYGFGIGGLVFGGAAGPVFAGNAPIFEGLGANTDDSDDEEGDDTENQRDAPQTPVLRPLRPTINILYPYNRDMKNNKVNSHENQSAENMNPRVQSRPNADRNANGETIGYVAFIFPRRSSNKPNNPPTDHSRSTETHKPANADAKLKPKASAKPKINRFAPFFVPLPVQIPIDRPYPVPVPYEVVKPFAVPVAVEVPKPANVDIPVLIGQPNLFLQPSIIHKRSDKVAKPS